MKWPSTRAGSPKRWHGGSPRGAAGTEGVPTSALGAPDSGSAPPLHTPARLPHHPGPADRPALFPSAGRAAFPRSAQVSRIPPVPDDTSVKYPDIASVLCSFEQDGRDTCLVRPSARAAPIPRRTPAARAAARTTRTSAGVRCTPACPTSTPSSGPTPWRSSAPTTPRAAPTPAHPAARHLGRRRPAPPGQSRPRRRRPGRRHGQVHRGLRPPRPRPRRRGRVSAAPPGRSAPREGTPAARRRPARRLRRTPRAGQPCRPRRRLRHGRPRPRRAHGGRPHPHPRPDQAARQRVPGLAAQEQNMTTADAHEGLRAFVERRPPEFRGR